MRRRIYVNPEGDLEDNTDRPESFMNQEPWDRVEICKTGALYDEVLWARYLDACKESGRLRGLVCGALRFEPLDEVEARIAARQDDMWRRLEELTESDMEEVMRESDQLKEEALANAATKAP